MDFKEYAHITQVAEEAKFDTIFFQDTVGVAGSRALARGERTRAKLSRTVKLEPTAALAALAMVTSRIGLVATATTTYNEPYNIARRFASLDHLSGGRAAWNVVTTFVPDVAANFSDASLPNHDGRYERANESVDIVRRLWASWEQEALVGDKARGVFADGSRVHPINHTGAHYSVRGPLTLPRSPQGWPVLFQAGSSEPGRELAARFADVVFTAQNTVEAATEFRTDVRRRVKAHGRDPDSVRVLPGLLPVLGGTEAEARARKDKLDELGGHAELKKLALRVGVKVEDLKLDEPMPVELIEANSGFRGSRGFRNAAVRLATEEKLTVREVLYRNGGGHRQAVGTPEQVADMIEAWHREGAADGFNLMIDVLPSGLRDFVEQVVPLLQRRGAFQRDYAGATLRENLGLPKPQLH
jgi:FMN-dependent oxidoreductase (nitrilotriacetate monooxygenase family)